MLFSYDLKSVFNFWLFMKRNSFNGNYQGQSGKIVLLEARELERIRHRINPYF
jgi:hypothetical protein